MRFAANLGRREHLHNSAVGKAMLSLLPEEKRARDRRRNRAPGKTPHTIVEPAALLRDSTTVRRRGYAIDDEEDNDGVFCVGSAVVDHSGSCLGAISVTGLKLDLPAWRVERLGEAVREHAAPHLGAARAPPMRALGRPCDEPARPRRRAAGLAHARRAPRLAPGPGEVVVRPVYCGLCGSDLELMRGEVDAAFVRYPLTLGHEWSGTIAAVGAGVSGLAPGQRCVAEGIIPCGHCASACCRRDERLRYLRRDRVHP